MIRMLANSDGTVVTATPSIAITDDDDVLAVYIAAGTVGRSNWVVSEAERVTAIDSMPRSDLREHRDVVIDREQVRLYLPGAGFSVGLSFGREGELVSWYGNLEAPFARTPIGIDSRDFALDVIAYPDRTWRWKDEDEFAHRLETGRDSTEHQARVRSAGQDFVRRFEAGSWPFDAGWDRWRPPDEWGVRTLPATWADDYGTGRLVARAR